MKQADSQTTLVKRLRLSQNGIDLHPSHYRKDCGDAADEIEKLKRCLNGRDDFIVSKGLWPEFVAQVEVTKP